ncbi:MAG: enoyl-CoA hydratase/isomerase family protein [Dehalococcoidia bacterium]|nr:enoyl-CoA hydratase/isomerase family protein [Dehalococcoidia bacterium]
MRYDTIILQKENGVAVMTLNRPESLNAVSPAMWFELSAVFEEVRNDDSLRVLVLTGAGRGFCAGADVAETLTLAVSGNAPPRTKEQLKEPVGAAGLKLAQLGKPTVAAVNGVAAGMGFSLAAACDIRIASENARFVNAFVRNGLIPDNGLTYFLPRLVGWSRALEIMYTGSRITADEAEKIGLVNRVVPQDELMGSALEVAGRIAEAAPIAVEMTRRTALMALSCSLEELIAFETYAQKVCLESEDFKEGVAAFLEKRPAVFKGL